MQHPHRIFITGTNRGLGKDLVKLLVAQYPQTEIHISARTTPAQSNEHWNKQIGKHNLHSYQIDLNSPHSILAAKQLIQSQNVTFDTIVANAAVGCDYGTQIPSVQLATQTLHVNTVATINFIKQFLPLLTPNGRVVIVSSIMGALNVQSEPFRNLLENPNITEAQILEIARKYIDSAAKKQMGYFHWSAYRTSKALLNAWSRFILPTYLKQQQSAVCLHPGWCQTDMGGKAATLTSQQGARRINQGIWLKQVQNGKFYNQGFRDYIYCQ